MGEYAPDPRQKPGKGTKTFCNTLISLEILQELLHHPKPYLLLSHLTFHPGTPSLPHSLPQDHKITQLRLFGYWDGVVSVTRQEGVPLF